MNSALYLLTCLTSLLCAILLLRAYFNVRRRLLLWAGLCFAGMAISNFLVFLDLVVLVDMDLYTYRLAASAISICLLLWGLVWESR
jgi:hypothetical protein